MALKRKTRKTNRRSQKGSHRKRTTRRRVISGGNYERDFTSRTIGGIATKSANKFVISAPGYGVMSGAAFLKLKEALDRNGYDFYA